MKITKEYAGLKRQNNGDYIINGDLISDEDIEIELDNWLRVTGKIESKKTITTKKNLIAGYDIEAGYGIEAGCGIEAGDGIKAGDGIEAGCGIKAGLSIVCKWIKARLRIFAGICIWRNPTEEETTITCEEVKDGTIAFGKLNIITKKEAKKMTVSEICKELGYDVEIIKENSDE